MPYIHFTEEQKLRASEVDLVEFLRCQGEKLIRSGPEYRLGRDHSVTVRGNGGCDHTVKAGGGPISFDQQFYNLSYPEAITCLLGGEQGIVYAAATHFSRSGNLDNIKSKTVGNGKHGTARWANPKELKQTYQHIPFHVAEWRSGKNLPKKQGLVLPEEDPSKNFMAGPMLQTLPRELFSVADENSGKLPNRVVLFCDELGTMPAFGILPLFSADRSRKQTLVPIIQSLAQLQHSHGNRPRLH